MGRERKRERETGLGGGGAGVCMWNCIMKVLMELKRCGTASKFYVYGFPVHNVQSTFMSTEVTHAELKYFSGCECQKHVKSL